MDFVLFDCEFTAWPGSAQRHWSEPWEHRELIQLAAVKLRLRREELVVIASFNELIKPVLNPQLSDYISTLTGIQQTMVDEMGVDFASALTSFFSFSQHGQLPCVAWGNDEAVLRENCSLYKLAWPEFGRFTNLRQRLLEAGISCANLASGELASHLELPLQGHKHNALFDVRSVTAALNYWLGQRVLTPAELQSVADASD